MPSAGPAPGPPIIPGNPCPGIAYAVPETTTIVTVAMSILFIVLPPFISRFFVFSGIRF
jgi:hypothetical protein